ncbi:MAG TPA: pyridoxine 5'-phosphate synthase [Bacteroidota bacterium]|nr:pyridoxine 5'-phosphate synthase [Bacteroidota bacterium]
MRLCVNIDHIATLRNARGGTLPDPVAAAAVCERAGADGIVCHLREDRRHIRDGDVTRLRRHLTTKLDLEMAATPEIVGIALKVKPDLVTLVPEKRKELTTEGGLDVIRLRTSLTNVIARFHDRGIPVSLFIDPAKNQIECSREIGADMIEIHTGEYADATTSARRSKCLRSVGSAAKIALNLGLGVNAGHGLGYDNIKPVTRIREIEEVSIGHALIVHAVSVGLERAVKEMVRLVSAAR